MLLASGPGVTNLQDYSQSYYDNSLSITSAQGDQIDQFKVTIHDPLNTYPLTTEDDIVVLEATDPNGWPTCNLLLNPSFAAPYTSGVAANWAGSNTGATGVTATQNTTTTQFGSSSQSLQLANAASGLNVGVIQSVALPHDSTQTVINKLPYYGSIYVYTSVAVAGATAQLRLEWWTTAFGSLARADSVSVPVGAGQVGQWLRYSISGTPPATAVYVKLIFYLTTSSATNSGTVLLDGAQLEYATFLNAKLPNGQTALAAGKYPTPYCDASQPGCNVDRGLSGCAYRQYRRFGGFIRALTPDYQKLGGSEVDIEIEASDYGIMLTESPANLILLPQSDYSCIQQAFQYGVNQGHLVGIDYTTYVSTIGPMNGYVFNWQTTRDVMNTISNATVAAYYVDYHKFLHYHPALATSAPFSLSSTPDMSASFPMSRLKIRKDSTQTQTAPVIEGSTQLSAPLSQSFTALATTLASSGPTANVSGAMAAGLTAIPVASNGTAFTAGMVIQLGVNTANKEELTVASGSTATSIKLTSATANTHSNTDLVAQVALTNNSVITSLSCPATTNGTTKANTLLTLSNGTESLQVIVASDVANGSTSIPIQSVTLNADYARGCNITTTGVIVNSAQPIIQMDTVSIGGAGQTIGLYSVNTFAQGYSTLYDPTSAYVYFQNAAANGAAVTLVYRFNSPVLIRLHWPSSESSTGKVRRRIHKHTKIDEITSQQAAVDRANADLSSQSKEVPVGSCTVTAPPAPVLPMIQHGTAISVNYPPGGIFNTLYQIQKVTQKPLTNNGVVAGVQYDLELGFYQPDFRIQFAQNQRDLAHQGTNITPGTVLLDVISAEDGWAVTDSITSQVVNVGSWGGSSTWGGAYAWG